MRLDCRGCFHRCSTDEKDLDKEGVDHFCYANPPSVLVHEGKLTSVRPFTKLHWFCSKWKERK